MVKHHLRPGGASGITPSYLGSTPQRMPAIPGRRNAAQPTLRSLGCDKSGMKMLLTEEVE
jgi:hypothetical protein